ncbi:uncharacterized protein Z518_05202 [Rhinocladiella mackenziei CBS 650.93]|uniref:Uncharacterized protein n=1 Tax=Rhinocladiella mackenziei CBS 650.93 TaxID=1442369 RepID=A0A0D2IEU3_9EURO|nr:uncharacterized protein Z518_05202 [Rhinocladiella mackenziei CBS 650.93]KIX04334.1 hypothetical protein Z518_05202 [Rhinocladiella mackenziei CBS 650.93]
MAAALELPRQPDGYIALITENGNFGDLFWTRNEHDKDTNDEEEIWSISNNPGSELDSEVNDEQSKAGKNTSTTKQNLNP